MTAIAATAAVSAPGCAAREGSPVTKSRLRSRSRSAAEKPPSGPIKTPAGVRQFASRMGQWILAVVSLVAEDDAPVARPVHEKVLELAGFLDCRDAEHAGIASPLR